MSYILRLMKRRFTGRVTIWFDKGSIVDVERYTKGDMELFVET